MFKPFKDNSITFLELGIYEGGSLLFWNDFFPNATNLGVDLELPAKFPINEKIQMFRGDQTDKILLINLINKVSIDGLDLIIDDASHYGQFSKISFWHLFLNYLKPGGLYVIEDLGTGYWDEWPDGKSLDLGEQQNQSEIVSKDPFPCHFYGMVGFIKQLVDELAASDITKNDEWKQRNLTFESMIIYHQLFSKKSPKLIFIELFI